MNYKNAILSDVKSQLIALSSAEIKKIMFYYYEGIGICRDGEFLPGFDELNDELIPDDSDLVERLFDIAYSAAEGIENNQYMMTCISRVGRQGMLDYYNRIKTDADINVANCLIFMFCLEKITKACFADSKLTDALVKETAEIYSLKNLVKNAIVQRSLFVPVKAISIRKSTELLQKQLASKTTNISKGRFLMKMNIIEAVLADIFKGNFSNAMVGLLLLRTYLPVNENSKMYIEGEQHLTQQDGVDRWGDLYRVWNFAFVSSEFQSCGFVGSKLLIPSVNGVEIDNEFRHTRLVSLYAMLNIITRGGKYTEFAKTQHRDKEFVRKLGWANLENALAYLVDLKTK